MKAAFDDYIRGSTNQRGGRIPDHVVSEIIDETMLLMNGIFRKHDAAGNLNLSKDELNFVRLAKGSHPRQKSAKSTSSEKSYLFQHPHLAVELLARVHPDAFESFLAQDPEFKQRMASNWNLRPKHGGLDDAIMAEAVYPPGKEPRSR